VQSSVVDGQCDSLRDVLDERPILLVAVIWMFSCRTVLKPGSVKVMV
jgi:hypothetical protein